MATNDSKTKAPKTTKPAEPQSTVFVTAVGPAALALCGEMIKTWNMRDGGLDGFEPYEPQDILETALSSGLHVLALRDLGNAAAWDDETLVSKGANEDALALETVLGRAAQVVLR